MVIFNRRSFAIGMIMSMGFLLALALIFSPVFGNAMNGLEYADDVFNKLSKASSYFIPKVARDSEKLVGTRFAVDIRLESGEQAVRALTLLTAAGVSVERREAKLSIAGDLGQLLGQVLHDAESGYRNEDATLSARYDIPGQVVLATWWRVLRAMGKAFAGEHKAAQAEAVQAVMKKAIEPAHNYYGIEAQNASALAATMTALLVFYVMYTIWWGSAIYFLFEGFGLLMQKAPAPPRSFTAGAVEQSRPAA